MFWWDAGADERGGLENRYTRKGIGGSNPPPTARLLNKYMNFLTQYSWILAVVAFVAAVFAFVKVSGFEQRLSTIFRGEEGKDLEGVIAEATRRLVAAEQEFRNLRDDVARIDIMAEKAVQKVGVVRFNPFEGVGGDQSFAIALLDSHNHGLVVSSLFTREGTRVFSKPIVKGESKYHLSDEENEAIRRALQGE